MVQTGFTARKWSNLFVVAQLLNCVLFFATPWAAALQASLSIINSRSLLKLMSIELVMPSNHLILSCPQSFPASGCFQMSWLFTSGGQITGASASASVLPMNIQGWFPLGYDWFDLLEVQGTLKSLLQHHNLKASILQCSAFLMIQFAHLNITIGKTIALTIWAQRA